MCLQSPATECGQTAQLQDCLTINKKQKIQFINQPKNREAVLILCLLLHIVCVLVSLFIKNQLIHLFDVIHCTV
jgi:hypothetical protein